MRIGDADSLLTAAADPAWIMTPAGRRPVWLLLVTTPRQRRVTPRRGRRSHLGDRRPAVLSRRRFHPGACARRAAPAFRSRALSRNGSRRHRRRCSRRAGYRAVAQDRARLGTAGARPPRGAGARRRGRLGAGTAVPPREARAVRRVVASRATRGRRAALLDLRWLHRRRPLPAVHAGRVSAAGGSACCTRPSSASWRRRRATPAYSCVPDAGPVADAWARLCGGVVEPWDAHARDHRAAMLPYPAELFLVQSRVLENAETGMLAGRADSLRITPPVSSFFWMPAATDAPARTAEYVRGSTATCRPCLVGTSVEGRLALAQVEVDSARGAAGSRRTGTAVGAVRHVCAGARFGAGRWRRAQRRRRPLLAHRRAPWAPRRPGMGRAAVAAPR